MQERFNRHLPLVTFNRSNTGIIMDKKKNKKKVKNIIPEYDTFALHGGEKDERSGTTKPYVEGVKAAKEFVEENKK